MTEEQTGGELLPRAQIVTRDDLEEAVAEIKVSRIRIIEFRGMALLIVFVRPKHHAAIFELLETRLPEGIGFAIGTLSFWELMLSRRVYHLL